MKDCRHNSSPSELIDINSLDSSGKWIAPSDPMTGLPEISPTFTSQVTILSFFGPRKELFPDPPELARKRGQGVFAKQNFLLWLFGFTHFSVYCDCS